MANLTITVDPETLTRARIKAIHEGTSVNKVLGKYLGAYAEDAVEPEQEDENGERLNWFGRLRDQVEAPTLSEAERQEWIRSLDELWAIVDKEGSGSGPGGRGWTREEIYDRPIMRLDRDDRDSA